MSSKNTGCAAVLFIIAILVGFFAFLCLAMAFDGMFLERDSDLVVGGLVLGIPSGLITWALIRAGIKRATGYTKPTYVAPVEMPVSTGAAPAPAGAGAYAAPNGAPQIVEVTTVAGNDNPNFADFTAAPEHIPMAPVPVPAPAPAPAPTPAPAPAPAPSRTGLFTRDDAASSDSSVEKLILRSSDVFATLKDFADHPADNENDAALAAMLNAAGITQWADAPRVEAVKLGRSKCFWLGNSTDDLSDEDHSRFLSMECALNVSQAMRLKHCSAQEVLRGVLDLEPNVSRQALPGVDEGALEQGEWMVRLRFAEFAENISAPYRIMMGMQANVAQGIFAIDLSVPTPDTMAFFATNRTGRICAARAYALRSALLCARGAFTVNPAINRVVVNCGTPRRSGTLLSLDLTRESLARLTPAAREASIDANGFPSDPALRVEFDEEGWFKDIEPFMPIDSELVAPPERYEPVELDARPAEGLFAKACGAATVSDMGINENAGRIVAWNRFNEALGETSTTGEAVSRLVSIRDSAQDVSVAEAAERVSKALVDGSLDVADRPAMGKLFVDGGLLDKVVSAAQDALDDVEHADLEAHLNALENALAPITSMGAYLDDNTQVYRYFNSLAERAWFNINLRDPARAVRLVPDSYYSAHSCCARILSMLDRGEEALAHTDELVRIAPATPDAALVRVRVLENMSRIYDAADLLKETISRCSTTRDLAICHYRLAYMQWKLGRNDLAVACYEYAIALDTPVMQQARDELEDLLQSDSSLAHLNKEETLSALAAASIPTKDPYEMRAAAAREAIGATDANLHSIAAPLVGTLIDMGRDDVLVDLYHSLRLGV